MRRREFPGVIGAAAVAWRKWHGVVRRIVILYELFAVPTSAMSGAQLRRKNYERR